MSNGASSNNPAVSVVAAALNEEQVIPAFCSRVMKVCEALGVSFEVIVVDDGSTDGTWKRLRALSQTDRRLSAVRLARNFGHQAALSAGLQVAKGETVLLIDVDLQDPPELLGEMLGAMKKENADIVYGQRLSREGVPWHLAFCYGLFYRALGWLAGCKIPPHTGDFRLVSRRAVDCINKMPEDQRFLRGMFSWAGFKQIPFGYHRKARAAGEPAYTWGKLTALAVDGIMSFSIKPLRLASALAAFLAVAGFSVMAWLVFGYAYLNHPPQGWTSLMVVILFLSALQLLVLGVIGEYVGRIFLAQKGRPEFIIAERT